jgi:phosphoenolpyruvate synthase/pyruvate phosphate dikinase
MIKIKFKNEYWYSSVTRNMSLFQSCFDVAGHFLYSKKYGVAIKKHLFIVENGTKMHACVTNTNKREYQKSVEKICLSAKKIKKLEDAYHKFGNNLLKASMALEKNISLKTFKDYKEANLHLSAGLFLTTTIGRHMYELLKIELKKLYPKMSAEEMDILIGSITYPSDFTPLAKSQISLLDIGAQLQRKIAGYGEIGKYNNIQKKFEKHLNNYAFIPVNFNEDPWSRQEILLQLKNLMKYDCQAEKNRTQQEHLRKIKLAKKLLQDICNKKINLIAQSLQTGTILNEYRKYIFCRASLAFRPLFEKISAGHNLAGWKECWKLAPDEIERLYFNKDLRILDFLDKRSWAGIIYAKNTSGYRLLEKNELAPLISKIKNDHAKTKTVLKTQNIKGVIANQGIIKGMVKIIHGKKDFYKFKDGDIIVSTMTSVDFVPLMQRAAAFVTDEGGITSHASIVSRELGKPCIIGTKIATQVLKDGDLVEVDANKGIVKILKRYEK